MTRAILILLLLAGCATKPSRNMNDMPFDQLIIELSKPIPDLSYRQPPRDGGAHP